jgi:hypothetical protein
MDMRMQRRHALLTLALWVFAAASIAQEAPADGTEPATPAAQAPAEDAPAQDAAEQLRKEAQEADKAQDGAGDDGAGSASAEQKPGKDEDGDFVPSEKIWADSALAFPSDI